MGLPYANPANTAQWSEDLLAALGDPLSGVDVANIQRVIGAESAGNTAGFMRDNNPWNLNTYTAPHTSLPGGTIVPEFGINVQTFPTATAGVDATAAQIKNSQQLTQALATGASPAAFGAALGSSAWGSGSYANSEKFPTLVPFEGSTPASNKPNPTGWFGQWIEPIIQNPVPLPGINGVPGGGVITNASGGLVSGVFAPLTGWIAKGAADVTFIAFGLLLIVIGLSITFKSEGEEAGKAAAVAA